jgi:DNA-binding CsgD family transcriptional regulator
MDKVANRTESAPRGHGLSPREQQCLACLRRGLSTGETAAALGIGRSTLDAHLMSARRKLGVRNTSQALLALARHDTNGAGGGRPAGSAYRNLSEGQETLADDLSRAESFAEAWRALHDYAGRFGITSINFGLIADPAGTLDDRSYSLWSSLPEELMQLYYAMGGAPHDPVARYVARAGGRPIIADPEYLGGELIAMLPPAARAMVEGLLDTHLNRQLCIPHRDPATGAAYCLNFAFDVCHRHEFEAAIAALGPELSRTTAMFWEEVQRARLIAGARGLTMRQRQALTLLARGFTLSEMAEHMNVSLRSVEKFLAGARARLGTRTNAQSVYRAMVYRALV